MGRGGAADPVPGASEHRTLQLKGHANFKRQNPRSDRFQVHEFHHVEFWCGDANITANRFAWGLGMPHVAKSDQSTGNAHFASYAVQSNDLTFVCTAPYSVKVDKSNGKAALPWYNLEQAHDFIKKHGLAVRALGILVADAKEAFEVACKNGARPAQEPTVLKDANGAEQVVSEIELYGDVVLRFVSGAYQGPYLASYTPVQDEHQKSYGLRRLDHAVGNAPKMMPVLQYIANATGFHEFAEFTADDVGTVDSGLNSMVLGSNNEMVLLPVNEPTFGTPRKSQIQTYLEQNEGAGLQHLALKTDDIFHTMRELKARTYQGGFDFMPRASDAYYKNLPKKFDGKLTPEQLQQIEELGLLADIDDQGILLQIFTKPIGDRPTIFLEIIQRIGCELKVETPQGLKIEQAGGCGGFGKGNFSELFKSIEDYERTLNI
jgi:4-hydroxyphenylpyruvate dioxygenase